MPYVYGNPINYLDPLGLDRYDICKDKNPLLESVCRACVGTACGFPMADKFCCKVDFDDCIGESNGDAEKMKICTAQLHACNLKKSKKPPKKGPKDKDVSAEGCGGDGGECQR